MSEEKEKPDLVVDEDWKSQVAAENASIDEKHKEKSSEEDQSSSGAEGPEAGPERIDPSQLPPADFPFLVTMFSTQAMGALGMFPNPITNKPDFQPALAKHYIDLLGVLEEKTKGNLSDDEAQLIKTTLHELRMMYMQANSAKA